LEETLHVVSLPTAQIRLAAACIVLLLCHHAHMGADVHPPLLKSGPVIERWIVVYPGLRYWSLASVWCLALSQEIGEAVADRAQ
jgi:hypothetical protein